MILLFIVLLLVLILTCIRNYNQREDFVNYTKCSRLPVSKRILEVFGKDNLTKSKNWELFLPCGYTHIEKELSKLQVLNQSQKVFAVEGCDKIASKYWLWKVLENKFGEGYTNFFPKTYASNKLGIAKLIKNHKQGNKYIAKKDIQRQTGLTIIHDISKIRNVLTDNKNLVIQELLNNPFLIDNRKINLRVYLLITCKDGITKGYIHNNGFMYYTPKFFKKKKPTFPT